jgi:hypothetical protein
MNFMLTPIFTGHNLSYVMVVALWMTAKTTTAAMDDGSCNLNCPDNQPCIHGSADFSSHAVEMEGNLNGMHCDCSMGECSVVVVIVVVVVVVVVVVAESCKQVSSSISASPTCNILIPTSVLPCAVSF